MTKKKGDILGIIYLISGMAFFGSATPISKIVGQELPILTVSLFRVLLASLFLLPFVRKDLLRNIRSISRKDWLFIALISIFGMVGFTVFLIWGMKFIPGVIGSIVMSLAPALTGLGAYLFMSAPMGKKRITALGLGVAGVLVVNIFRKEFDVSDQSGFLIGIGLVFLAICCEAAYSLLGKKVTDSVSPILTTFLACLLSLPLFLGLALLDYDSSIWANSHSESWLALLWWGFGTLGAGSALWYSGVARTEGTTAAGFMAVMPISAILLSYFLLKEPFQYIHLVGIILVLGSVGIMGQVHMEE